MQISELAAATNEATRTLRFYEAEGLLPLSKRTPGGYRDYDETSVDQVRFVRALQHAGLRLADIATLVHVCDDPGPISSNDATLIASTRLRIDHQLGTLSRMRAHLSSLPHETSTEDVSDDGAPPLHTSSSSSNYPQDD